MPRRRQQDRDLTAHRNFVRTIIPANIRSPTISSIITSTTSATTVLYSMQPSHDIRIYICMRTPRHSADRRRGPLRLRYAPGLKAGDKIYHLASSISIGTQVAASVVFVFFSPKLICYFKSLICYLNSRHS